MDLKLDGPAIRYAAAPAPVATSSHSVLPAAVPIAYGAYQAEWKGPYQPHDIMIGIGVVRTQFGPFPFASPGWTYGAPTSCDQVGPFFLWSEPSLTSKLPCQRENRQNLEVREGQGP